MARGHLTVEGRARATKYRVSPAARAASPTIERSVALEGLAEDEVWKEIEQQLPESVPHDTRVIAHFAFTEMLNNAIDHSGGSTAHVSLTLMPGRITFDIADDGVGVFRRVMLAHGFSDELTALQELSKGKLTSAPEKHTGLGIFLTSKAVNVFELRSDAMRWVVDNDRTDVAYGSAPTLVGTRVHVEISMPPKQTLEQVFHAQNPNMEFDQSLVYVRMFDTGVTFVSRSEAKRLAMGLEKFKRVIVDFRGVELIGQAFADELFRVWAKAHTGTQLEPVNMNPIVASLVAAARR